MFQKAFLPKRGSSFYPPAAYSIRGAVEIVVSMETWGSLRTALPDPYISHPLWHLLNLFGFSSLATRCRQRNFILFLHRLNYLRPFSLRFFVEFFG